MEHGMNGRKATERQPDMTDESRSDCSRVCPVCGSGMLLEIRQKLQCGRCHSIVETCCEGGRG
jgi:ribosomal protein S27AE